MTVRPLKVVCLLLNNFISGNSSCYFEIRIDNPSYELKRIRFSNSLFMQLEFIISIFSFILHYIFLSSLPHRCYILVYTYNAIDCINHRHGILLVNTIKSNTVILEKATIFILYRVATKYGNS